MRKWAGSLPLLPLVLSVVLHASFLGGLILRGLAPATVPDAATPLGISLIGNHAGNHAQKARLTKLPTSTPPEAGRGFHPLAASIDATREVNPTELAAYALEVRTRIGASLRYPLALRRRGVQGRVGLRLVLDSRGQVQTQEISEASGSKELDDLALEAARNAQPYPTPTTDLTKKGKLVLNLPVEFKLR